VQERIHESFESWYNDSPIHVRFTLAKQAMMSAEAHISESLGGRDTEAEDFRTFWKAQCDVISVEIDAIEARFRLMMRGFYYPQETAGWRYRKSYDPSVTPQ